MKLLIYVCIYMYICTDVGAKGNNELQAQTDSLYPWTLSPCSTHQVQSTQQLNTAATLEFCFPRTWITDFIF